MAEESEAREPRLKRYLEAKKQRRPLSWPVRAFLLAAIVLPLLTAYNATFGGLEGAAWSWFQWQSRVGEVVSWRVEVIGWLFFPLLIGGAYASRHVFPTVTVPLAGAGKHETKVKTYWYKPFSFKVTDDLATWKEGKYQAQANKAYIYKHTLMGYYLIKPMLRSVDEAAKRVTYETVDLEASRLHVGGQRERLLANQLVHAEMMLEHLGVRE